jgi:predicted regulator of Ras-like GTPase activity (Roadblock/LC7/MglB family)
MVDKGIGDYFITDADDEPSGADELLGAPVVVPVIPPRVQPVEAEPASPAPAVTAAPAVRPAVEASVIEALTPAAAEPRPQVAARPATREEQLAEALDELMRNDGDIQAAALVSLDGFTMASALPAGMQADRVGAMSAAILGLGERAAAELGRGHLSQVFIEGESGYVLLIAAGNRAVLTAMAEPSAKLGLVLYDMKSTADRIGQILG